MFTSGITSARKKPGGDDSAVVENEKIAGIQEGWEVGKVTVAELAGCAVENQHAAGAALGWGLLGYQLLGKVKVEVVEGELWLGGFGCHAVPFPRCR